MKVIIPDVLQSYTKSREVECRGENILAVFESLEGQFPGIRFRVINEQDELRPHFKLFINSVRCQDLSHPISATDELFIMQALSGG